MYDIIIVGAGPAGMTAALYGARANKKVLVLEAKSYGGQILNASKIENYPGIELINGFDYATTLYNQIKNLGVEIKYETVIRINEDKSVVTNKDTYNGRSVIIATGVQSRKLKLNNEDKYIGKGLSYCATCDGNFFKGKDVAVVGGGNTALEDVLYLSDIVNKVYLIHRRSEFRGEEKLYKEILSKDNVEVLLNVIVKNINGNDSIESIDIGNEDNNINIKIDGLFVAIGQEPRNEAFSNVVDLDKLGHIISEDGVHTKVDGIYVAGDTRVKMLRQLTTAVSDGSIAATTAIREMKGE